MHTLVTSHIYLAFFGHAFKANLSLPDVTYRPIEKKEMKFSENIDAPFLCNTVFEQIDNIKFEQINFKYSMW